MNNALQNLITSLSTILIGKSEIIDIIIASYLSRGNILLEDMPGVGKTILSKAISKLISNDNKELHFSRIQGTPDLLPYDITGVEIYNPATAEFRFHPGPVFTDLLLADELNRATPKVQSALLEAMAEKQVTVAGKTYTLSDQFVVIATQNPIDMEGTYPLPAAQLDRFMVSCTIGYPNEEFELQILTRGKSEKVLSNLSPVISLDEIKAIQTEINNVVFSENLMTALTKIARSTRENKELKTGLSTRALLSLIELAKSYAYIKGRNFVHDQDIIDLAPFCLAHRLITIHPRIDRKELINAVVREEIRKITYQV